ncbi:MAG: hypothetical protein HZA51_10835 [Planctomycetes bacterium]|nr:hypothetical protein [Planctomycetota bacterium]
MVHGAGCLPSVTLTYDQAGNLTVNPLARVVGDAPGASGGQWYKYDEENRVVEIRKTGFNGALLLQFTYDALGRRVQTTEYIDPQSGTSWDGLSGHPSPRITRHIYAGLEPIQEYTCGGPGTPACDGSYTLAREFIWGRPLSSSNGLEPVAMVDYTGANGVSGCSTGAPPAGCVYHYLRDALGSVTGLTDSTGHLVERYTCDPYGKTLIERYDPSANGGAGAWIATNASSFGNPWMWTGHRYDAAVGLYHTLFRHYSPQLGRWLQRDPIGYAAGSVNLYEYVLGNPLYWVDPFGLEAYNETASDAEAAEGAYGDAVGQLTGMINTGAQIAEAAGEFTGGVLITAATIVTPTPGDELASATMLANRLGRLIGKLEDLAKKSAKAKRLLEKAKKLRDKAAKKADELRETRKSNGCKGNPDHQNKVKEIAEEKRKTLEDGEEVLTEKKIRHPESNRRPDVQVVGRDKKVKEIVEVERRPNSARNLRREQEYNDLGIPHETVPLPPKPDP